MAENKSKVMEFAIIAFLLLGVLFGMQIMTFIFGNLSLASSTSLDDEGQTVINLTGTFINATGFTISEASDTNFAGSFAVTLALNATDNTTIAAPNYTVNAATGTITNATATVWDDVLLSYTFNTKTEAKLVTEGVSNNSLQSIATYTEQSDTQFNTVAIAITLVILIIVFLLFWNIFVRRNNSRSKAGGNFG